MKILLLALCFSLPLLAAPVKVAKTADQLKAQQNSAFCKIAKMPEKMRKAHGCK